MINSISSNAGWGIAHWRCNSASVLVLSLLFLSAAGCGTHRAATKKNDDFFTSGSREADQRASQRMAKDEQLTGSGEGAGEKGTKKATVSNSTGEGAPAGGATNTAAQVEGKLALFERLGGQKGIEAIVNDFIPRALQDPRVNWQRNGVRKGGISIHRQKSEAWETTDQNVTNLKTHFIQFLSLATGGPAKYEGKEMKSVHADMHITNPEFDAALGDLKASLDRLKVPNKEQKERKRCQRCRVRASRAGLDRRWRVSLVGLPPVWQKIGHLTRGH